ncbi:cyclin-dependent kinase regulatory subunit CKS1 [Nematocida parisii]|uniref:Cyclin-dependent kinases regulatory subunit n=1 Tax=Nematocida parisii (strain ERTm3) TaxID=935791 RepID=I3EDC3_NEMP3|nr:cyclin-dependent kinase regulatory subunit [Nematocida parisii ERTm1]EIJ87220.1 cyclin-dependent kinase regulatory subunit [Nematocida parisii ERTm3]KAI5143115.1 cyclin-dependent kinase regulatory subunit CKS1 [Nematocida parisii]EIJ95081.1 cyclin-dependent kinase regulatory subunit [Nematocida parisii ERTm1]KAI5153072.1 cyclin-dependent kinase regulatory subunit CKS1 [Nematocida parisii]KAI5156369.1 cyclin-dependent kinase regulatory subunit CKS1 [Nematocida parisii]|eukprot:XP_013058437.1 cyclin-dependent kinase regulatory subunit [Nematocida parisii ERTm1]
MTSDLIDIAALSEQIYYSETYADINNNLYRHVILPKELAQLLPRDRLLEETEWRALGITQSKGWRHYMRHNPEPHVLLFKKSAIH